VPQVGLTLRLVLGGSEGQRLLVARMTPTEEGRLMLAVDHKGRISYANTGLAALLGFKLAALRARDFAALLPTPYNVLHGKWLKVRTLRGSKLNAT
jgi:transcriptional regulator of aromatic amino acid metabolism